jgi:hypothetical protein
VAPLPVTLITNPYNCLYSLRQSPSLRGRVNGRCSGCFCSGASEDSSKRSSVKTLPAYDLRPLIENRMQVGEGLMPSMTFDSDRPAQKSFEDELCQRHAHHDRPALPQCVECLCLVARLPSSLPIALAVASASAVCSGDRCGASDPSARARSP